MYERICTFVTFLEILCLTVINTYVKITFELAYGFMLIIKLRENSHTVCQEKCIEPNETKGTPNRQ